jgi:hypothetical protein
MGFVLKDIFLYTAFSKYPGSQLSGTSTVNIATAAPPILSKLQARHITLISTVDFC